MTNKRDVLLSSFPIIWILFFFFFNDTATTEIYTLSLHDALPISARCCPRRLPAPRHQRQPRCSATNCLRSEEHTSELQSHSDLVCRLLLEKKKNRERSGRCGYCEDV